MLAHGTRMELESGKLTLHRDLGNRQGYRLVADAQAVTFMQYNNQDSFGGSLSPQALLAGERAELFLEWFGELAVQQLHDWLKKQGCE